MSKIDLGYKDKRSGRTNTMSFLNLNLIIAYLCNYGQQIGIKPILTTSLILAFICTPLISLTVFDFYNASSFQLEMPHAKRAMVLGCILPNAALSGLDTSLLATERRACLSF